MEQLKTGRRIYVDVDDVISKTTDTYAGVIAREFGKHVRFEDVVTFDLKESFGLTDNEFHYFFDLVHQPEVLLDYEPVDGALDGLQAWSDRGHGIDIVTGRPSSTQEPTLEWLSRHEVPFDSFTMVDKYNRAANDPGIAISKAELAARHYDLAVEDSRDMALFLAGRMGVKVLLYDRPWNALGIDHDKVRRVASWEEITRPETDPVPN